jgi:hypothetical protein
MNPHPTRADLWRIIASLLGVQVSDLEIQENHEAAMLMLLEARTLAARRGPE